MEGAARRQRAALGHRGPDPRQGTRRPVRCAVHRACTRGLRHERRARRRQAQDQRQIGFKDRRREELRRLHEEVNGVGTGESRLEINIDNG